MEKDKFAELHRLCKQNELYQQKAWGIGIALFGIGLQAFSGEIIFAAITAWIIGTGLYLLSREELLEVEE